MDILRQYFSDFTPVQEHQFAQLKDLYREWNEKINVISRKDIDSLYERHVLHSLAIAAIITFEGGARIVDIGTGGGFPGIPLAILFPECEFVLCDSIGKKIKVVEEVSHAIGLKNVAAIHTRVETLRTNSFDYAVSRAVAPLGELWNWIKPVLRKGRQTEAFANGLFCLKGGDLHQEISESGVNPHLWSVYDLFDIDFFKEKYVVYVPR